MKFLAAIQARSGSTRLPNKIHMDLQGKTVLNRVIDRVSNSKYVDEVIVITSFNKEDITTLNLVSTLGYRVFAGSSEDVLDRYYQSAKLIKPKYIIRITADCPLFDPQLLDTAIEQLNSDTDYLGAISETLADGLDLEIFTFEALKKAWQEADMVSEREHVTLFMRNNPKLFKLQDFICPLGNLNKERFTLDEKEDYALISEIYAHFKNREFYTKDILDFLDMHPNLRNLNAKYARNEGLAKSLANDEKITD